MPPKRTVSEAAAKMTDRGWEEWSNLETTYDRLKSAVEQSAVLLRASRRRDMTEELLRGIQHLRIAMDDVAASRSRLIDPDGQIEADVVKDCCGDKELAQTSLRRMGLNYWRQTEVPPEVADTSDMWDTMTDISRIRMVLEEMDRRKKGNPNRGE